MYINKQVDGGDLRSDYRIENMNIGISGNIFDQWGGGGVTQGYATLTKGQLVFGNTSPQTVLTPYGTFTPTVFSKLNFVLSRNQQIVPDKTILNATISGQIASVDLDSAEKFYLGGPNGIKGYPGSQGAGSQGAMLNLELQQALDDKMIASVFYDAGFVQQWRDGGNFTSNQGATAAKNTYSLSSLGLGLKRPGKDITWSTVLAWKLGENPLRDNNGQGVNNDGRSKSAYLWAQMQWVF
jgi:hemolysin activation/secretion protein